MLTIFHVAGLGQAVLLGVKAKGPARAFPQQSPIEGLSRGRLMPSRKMKNDPE
jgi:hypothetical protein